MIATRGSWLEGEGMSPRREHPRNVGQVERLGSILCGGALAGFGLLRKSWSGAAAAIAGGALLFRGLSGRCAVYEALGVSTSRDRASAVERRLARRGVKVEKTVTIRTPARDLYAFWRDFENLPRFLRHVESVKVIDERLSHWKVKGPFGARFEWDAEVVNERENEIIAWRTLDGSAVDHAGSVHFERMPDDPWTRLHVVLKYNPPAGTLSTAVARLLGQDPRRELEEDLVRLQQIFEARGRPVAPGRLPDTGAFAPSRVKEEPWAERFPAPPTGGPGSAPPGASTSST